MKFNEKLIKLRNKKGLSQEKLGEQLNVARQTVSKWELGETTPEMDKLIKMSEIFNVNLDELMKDNDITEEKDYNNINTNNKNTQKLAGIIIIILKVFGVIVLMCIALSIIAVILFGVNTNSFSQKTNTTETYKIIDGK